MTYYRGTDINSFCNCEMNVTSCKPAASSAAKALPARQGRRALPDPQADRSVLRVPRELQVQPVPKVR